jgi:hypothetical protein
VVSSALTAGSGVSGVGSGCSVDEDGSAEVEFSECVDDEPESTSRSDGYAWNGLRNTIFCTKGGLTIGIRGDCCSNLLHRSKDTLKDMTKQKS